MCLGVCRQQIATHRNRNILSSWMSLRSNARNSVIVGLEVLASACVRKNRMVKE